MGAALSLPPLRPPKEPTAELLEEVVANLRRWIALQEEVLAEWDDIPDAVFFGVNSAMPARRALMIRATLDFLSESRANAVAISEGLLPDLYPEPLRSEALELCETLCERLDEVEELLEQALDLAAVAEVDREDTVPHEAVAGR